jgi:hypothetical protein
MDGGDFSDFARRTLRTWAVLDAVQAAILIALTLLALPGKFPAVNVALVVYALSLALPAWALARGRRWAWWLAVGTSLVGLLAAAVAVVGLVASWAYLRAVYGQFGFGASIASLLLAGMVWQVLGLYPAVRLRAMLRREVRAFVGTGRRPATPVAITAVVLLALPLPVGVGVHAWYALAPVAPVSSEAMAQSLAVVRSQLAGGAVPAAPALDGVDQQIGPVHATLWREGRAVARARGDGAHLSDAVRQAGGRLAAELRTRGERPEGRLKLDRVVARGPVPRWRPLLGLSVDPGLDGLQAGDDPAGATVLPDDLLAAAVAGAAAPLPQLDELRLGVDARWLEQRLGAAVRSGRLQRLRLESWIEGPKPGEPGLRVYRGQVLAAPPPARTAATLAGDFILRQVESDGRFGYRYDPLGDVALDGGGYSIPRHAGTAYGLVLLFATTGEPRFRDAARDALSWLALQLAPTCGGSPGLACISDGGQASVGASALSAVAMLEYQRRTGDRRYQDLGQRLLAFLRGLQQPGGDFAHQYDSDAGAALPGPPKMFVSEQAALALVLGHRLFGQAADLQAAERALDFLTGAKYDFFLGRFIYGSDHWTCIAAEEAWPALRHRRYLDFCTGYAAFMSRLQYPAEPESPARDFAGHYGFSYLLVPQAPATAGFTEALLSTLALAGHHRAPTERLREQSRAALGALVRDQLRPENSYLVRNPARAEGAFRRSLVEPEVRIDFVQHAASALIRGHALGVL